MIECPKCGAPNRNNSAFCYSCGAALTTKAREIAAATAPATSPATASVARGFERERRADLMGLAGFAFFLLIAGIILAVNPNLFTDFLDWTRRMADTGRLLRPPEGLLASAVLFFGLIGLSSFVVAGLRLVGRGPRIRALADTFAGVALLVFAYLLTLYANHTLGGQTVLALEAAVAGALILGYIAVGLWWGFGRRAPTPEPQRPAARP